MRSDPQKAAIGMCWMHLPTSLHIRTYIGVSMDLEKEENGCGVLRSLNFYFELIHRAVKLALTLALTYYVHT